VHSKNKKIYFDVYGDKSLNIAKKLNADGVKISTTDFHNDKLVSKAIENFENILLSMGGIEFEDIDKFIKKTNSKYLKKITLMYGFQAEPTNINDNNLLRITSLRERYRGVKVGFMDHTLGCSDNAFYIPLISLGMGVTCIEKHITLDYELQIEDHISGLSIDRFKKFIDIINSSIRSLGTSKLTLTLKEKQYFDKSSKILVSSKNLRKGHIVNENDIEMKRYSINISEFWYRKKRDLIGKKLSVNLVKNEPFLRDSVL
jgi:sialic acid synthase SpsE